MIVIHDVRMDICEGDCPSKPAECVEADIRIGPKTFRKVLCLEHLTNLLRNLIHEVGGQIVMEVNRERARGGREA